MAATDIERRWYASGDEIAALLSSLNAFLSGELPEDRVQRINIETRVALRLRLRQIRIDWHRWDYHQCRWKGLDDRLPRFGVNDLAENTLLLLVPKSMRSYPSGTVTVMVPTYA